MNLDFQLTKQYTPARIKFYKAVIEVREEIAKIEQVILRALMDRGGALWTWDLASPFRQVTQLSEESTISFVLLWMI